MDRHLVYMRGSNKKKLNHSSGRGRCPHRDPGLGIDNCPELPPSNSKHFDLHRIAAVGQKCASRNDDMGTKSSPAGRDCARLTGMCLPAPRSD